MLGSIPLLRTFLNKSTPPLRSLPSEVKNLFHCLALSGLFLFLWDHGDLRRARSEEEEEGEEEATTKRAERKWIQEDEEGERGDVNGEEGLDEEDVV